MASRSRPLLLAGMTCLVGLGSRAHALDETPCRLEVGAVPAAFGRCATLTVPEDPAVPKGPSLELAVARIPASSATPRPDPLVLIAGGPGQSTIDFYLQLRAAFEPARRDRDIILLDQRGTGRSAAGMQCAPPEGVELETAGPELLRGVIADCRSRLERDPRLYTTSVAVRDLERLREALGVEQWNVYGVSYGTRVAQHYLRRYPDSVRAVILDGVVPPELALGPDVAPNAQAALEAIFGRCRDDALCARRFGDVGAKFERLLAELAGAAAELRAPDPVTGEPANLRFGQQELMAVIRLMSYSSQTAALLPLVVDEAAAGNLVPLAAQAQIVVQELATSLSFPMHNSVVCAEDVPFFPAEDGAAPDSGYLGTAIVDALVTICNEWPRGRMDPDFKLPITSERPMLLLSGEYDPITPPAYANRVAAQGLKNSVHVIGRAQGHGQAAIGCVPRLMRRFLEEPQPEKLAAACLHEEPPMPFFLSFQGPAP